MSVSSLRVLPFAVAALLIGAVAQAQQPEQRQQAQLGPKPATAVQPSAAPASTSAPSAAKGNVSAAQPIKTAAAQSSAGPSAQLVKDARDAGFKPAHVRGTLMFCRTAIELGSNFPVKTCYNEQQVTVKIQEYQTQRNQLRSGHFLPAGMPAGCNSLTCQ